MFAKSLCLALLFATRVFGHGQMSRHLVTEDLSMVVVLADAEATEGPYDEEVEDYIYTSDMTAAAKAGSAGVTTDRASVLDAVPLTLTLTVYDLSTADSGYANEFANVDVFLWHTDAAGVYSSVEQARQSKEGTDGQHWLRAYQTTGADGTVTFQTIMPGWYSGRTVHFHVRFRAHDSDSWAATTQFFVADADVDLYEDEDQYTSNSASQTSLASDNIYSGLDSSVRDILTLDLSGGVSSGFTANMEVGLICAECDGVASPTDAPTKAPEASPTTAPQPVPTVAPQVTPTNSPQATTTDAPVATSTDAPVASPTDAPQTGSTDAPVAASTNAPFASSAPTNRRNQGKNNGKNNGGKNPSSGGKLGKRRK
eukprot:Nitzschia sp. Nitz4//scaffold38_size140716//102556//103662//NITZ4_P3/40-5//1//CDS//3329550183//3814//frame0